MPRERKEDFDRFNKALLGSFAQSDAPSVNMFDGFSEHKLLIALNNLLVAYKKWQTDYYAHEDLKNFGIFFCKCFALLLRCAEKKTGEVEQQCRTFVENLMSLSPSGEIKKENSVRKLALPRLRGIWKKYWTLYREGKADLETIYEEFVKALILYSGVWQQVENGEVSINLDDTEAVELVASPTAAVPEAVAATETSIEIYSIKESSSSGFVSAADEREFTMRFERVIGRQGSYLFTFTKDACKLTASDAALTAEDAQTELTISINFLRHGLKQLSALNFLIEYEFIAILLFYIIHAIHEKAGEAEAQACYEKFYKQIDELIETLQGQLGISSIFSNRFLSGLLLDLKQLLLITEEFLRIRRQSISDFRCRVQAFHAKICGQVVIVGKTKLIRAQLINEKRLDQVMRHFESRWNSSVTLTYKYKFDKITVSVDHSSGFAQSFKFIFTHDGVTVKFRGDKVTNEEQREFLRAQLAEVSSRLTSNLTLLTALTELILLILIFIALMELEPDEDKRTDLEKDLWGKLREIFQAMLDSENCRGFYALIIEVAGLVERMSGRFGRGEGIRLVQELFDMRSQLRASAEAEEKLTHRGRLTEAATHSIDMQIRSSNKIDAWLRTGTPHTSFLTIHLTRRGVTIHRRRPHSGDMSKDEATNLLHTILHHYLEQSSLLTVTECLHLLLLCFFLYLVSQDKQVFEVIVQTVERMSGAHLTEIIRMIRLLVSQPPADYQSEIMVLVRNAFYITEGLQSRVSREYVQMRVEHFAYGNSWDDEFKVTAGEVDSFHLKLPGSTEQILKYVLTDDKTRLVNEAGDELTPTELTELLNRLEQALTSQSDLSIEVASLLMRLLILVRMTIYSMDVTEEEAVEFERRIFRILETLELSSDRPSRNQFREIKTFTCTHLREMKTNPEKRMKKVFLIIIERLTKVEAGEAALDELAATLDPQTTTHTAEAVDPPVMITEDLVCVASADSQICGGRTSLPPTVIVSETVEGEDVVEQAAPQVVLRWKTVIKLNDDLEFTFYLCNDNMYVVSGSDVVGLFRVPELEVPGEMIKMIFREVVYYFERQDSITDEEFRMLICMLTYLTWAARTQGVELEEDVIEFITKVLMEKFSITFVRPEELENMIRRRDILTVIHWCNQFLSRASKTQCFTAQDCFNFSERQTNQGTIIVRQTAKVKQFVYADEVIYHREETERLVLLLPHQYTPLSEQDIIDRIKWLCERLKKITSLHIRERYSSALSHYLYGYSQAGGDMAAIRELILGILEEEHVRNCFIKIFQLIESKSPLNMVLSTTMQEMTVDDSQDQTSSVSFLCTNRTRTAATAQATAEPAETTETSTTATITTTTQETEIQSIVQSKRTRKTFIPMYNYDGCDFNFMIVEGRIYMITRFIESMSIDSHVETALPETAVKAALELIERFIERCENPSNLTSLLIILTLLYKVLIDSGVEYDWRTHFDSMLVIVKKKNVKLLILRIQHFESQMSTWIAMSSDQLYETMMKVEATPHEAIVQPEAPKPKKAIIKMITEQKTSIKRASRIYFDHVNGKVTLTIEGHSLKENDETLTLDTIICYAEYIITELMGSLIHVQADKLTAYFVVLFVLLCAAEALKAFSTKDLMAKIMEILSHKCLRLNVSINTAAVRSMLDILFVEVSAFAALSDEEKSAKMQSGAGLLIGAADRVQEEKVKAPMSVKSLIADLRGQLVVTQPKEVVSIPLISGKKTVVQLLIPYQGFVLNIVLVAKDEGCYAVPLAHDGEAYVEGTHVLAMNEVRLRLLLKMLLDSLAGALEDHLRTSLIRAIKLVLLAYQSRGDALALLRELVANEDLRQQLEEYLAAAKKNGLDAMLEQSE